MSSENVVCVENNNANMNIAARTLYPIICVAIIISNIIILIAIKKSTYNSSLTTILLTILSILSLMLVPFHIIEYMVFVNGQWLLGEALCILTNFSLDFILNSSVFTLVAIGLDRYRAIVKPNSYSKTVYKHLWNNLLLIFSLGLITSFITTICSNIEVDGCDKKWCKKLRFGRDVAVYIFLFDLIFCYIIPSIFLLVIYTIINIKVYRMFNGKINTSIESTLESDISWTIWKTSLAAVLIFILTWTPYTLINFIRIWKGVSAVPFWVFATSKLIIDLYPLFNPIIYSLLNKNIKISVVVDDIKLMISNISK